MKKYLIPIVLILISSVIGRAQSTMCKSYAQAYAQGYANGQVASVQDGNGLVAICIWYDDNKTVNCNGHVYRYKGADMWGNFHYQYERTEPHMQFTLMNGMHRPIEVIFTQDWGRLRENYCFGMAGAYVPMSADYYFIGDGAEAAQEYRDANGYSNGGW